MDDRPSRDRFLPKMLQLALPIAGQQLLFSSLNMVEVLMLGQLGDAPVAAISLGKQVFFLYSLFLFGLSSGAAIFAAQSWGRQDRRRLHQVLGISLGLSLFVGLFFSIVAIGFPQAALSLYSQDPLVVAMGSRYLRIVGLSYLASAITLTYAAVLRSAEYVRLPTLVSVVALVVNTALSYLLIFGHLGLPALEVEGAAIATCLSRYLECMALVALTYWTRSPAAAHPRQMAQVDRSFVGQFLRTCMPVVVTEVLWSLGVTAYNAIYAHIGTEAITAFSIASTIEGLAFVPFIGIANACAIMIGNEIGAGNERRAFEYARRCMLIAFCGALLFGMGLFFSREAVLSLYQVSPATHRDASVVMTVMACALWVKMSNLTVLIGIIRSGGDTVVGFLIDAGSMWVVGVPLALVGAFLLHLPIYWVVALVMADEVTKLAIGLPRVFSRRWIRNVVRPAAP